MHEMKKSSNETRTCKKKHKMQRPLPLQCRYDLPKVVTGMAHITWTLCAGPMKLTEYARYSVEIFILFIFSNPK